MRKIYLLLLLLVLLAACGGQEPAEPVDEPILEKSDPPTAAAPETNSTAELPLADAITPAETATEAATVRERDWTKGAEDPLITIIEYGDFQ